MDYFRIGQQIRKFRRARGFSQEQLAEKIGISVTHMSHIETGNTKLSLPVFVDISRALDTSMDALLGEGPPERQYSTNELSALLESCSLRQLRIITDIAKATKSALEMYED